MARAWPQRRVDRAREAWDDVPTAGPADLGGGFGHRGLAIEAHARERSPERSPICVMRRRAPRHYSLPREAGSASSSSPSQDKRPGFFFRVLRERPSLETSPYAPPRRRAEQGRLRKIARFPEGSRGPARDTANRREPERRRQELVSFVMSRPAMARHRTDPKNFALLGDAPASAWCLGYLDDNRTRAGKVICRGGAGHRQAWPGRAPPSRSAK